MLQFTASIDGIDVINRKLSRVGAGLEDMRPAFEVMASQLFVIEAKNFKQQGYPEKFPPLSPRYAKWKARVAPGKPIMQLTGRLKDSLTGENQAGYQDTIKRVYKDHLVFGTKTPYAHRHQVGYRMPIRKSIQIAPVDKDRLTKTLHRYAMGLFSDTESYRERFGAG